jgi:hypothetical protein
MQTHSLARLAAASAGALAVAACSLGLGAAGAVAATAPPELQALEQKAESLKVTSERFELQFLVRAPSGKETTLLGEGVAAISPARAALTETADGKRLAIRVVGRSIFVEYPGLARLDGGRPWVRVPETRLAEESDVNLTAAPQSASQAYALLNAASTTISEVGPATVEGQPTTEFSATVDLDALLSRFGPKLVAKLQQAGITTATLQEYIAPDGMPVRTAVQVAAEGGTITATSTVLAVDVPVSVSAPPRGRTISDTRFVAIEHRNRRG